jgi:hypothetical protein
LSSAIGRAFAEQISGGSSGGCPAAIIAATAALARETLCGIAERRSVAKRLPSQYQRWSTSLPPIITAERSLPATATLRLPRAEALSRSPSVPTFRCTGETV